MEEKSMGFQTINFISYLSSDPLFSTIITLYSLILIYFPTLFFKIIFSPVLVFTAVLLLTLLRIGAIQKIQQDSHNSPCETNIELEIKTNSGCDPDPNPFYDGSFFEWNVGAPLEVIYEAYEGEEEEEEEEENEDVSKEKGSYGIERYPSLSKYYPDSDTDSSSDEDFPVIEGWDSPERMGFRWDEEDRDGLIEISLDGKRTSTFFHAEEENLIEIDISPPRKDEW